MPIEVVSKITRSVESFFTKGHQRSVEAKRNILALFFYKGLSIGISLIMVPLTINYINPTQYGIWLTLSSIIAWFGFFDIGFGNGLRNKYAEAKASGNYALAKTYLSTTYAVLFLIFGLVFATFIMINQFLNWSTILNAPAEMMRELSGLAVIVFGFFCIQMVVRTISTVVVADQKPAKASFFDLSAQVITLLIIYILTKTTNGSLLYLGLTLGITPVVILGIATAFLYKGTYRHVAPTFKQVKFGYAKEILVLGVRFFIIQIAAIIIYQTNNIIIAQLFGPADVTTYNIAFKYFNVVTMGFNIILTPFWSAFTEAKALNEYEWMINIVKKLKLLWILLVVAALILLVFSDLMYRLWVGDAVSVPFSVSISMFIYTVVFNWGAIFSQITAGIGKIKLQLYVAIFGAVINIPMAILLGNKFGINGIIFSSIVLGLITAIWNPIQISKILHRRAKGIWNE